MPVQLFGRIGLVMNVDRDLLAFLESQKRPGELAVIGSHGDDVIRSQFNRLNGDRQGVICFGVFFFRLGF